jgi:putative membrane protein
MYVFILIVKALHIIFVISWMAGLLYLPRLFVYHSQVKVKSPESEMFRKMERRLTWVIMTPAMILSFIFGGMLLSYPGFIDWGSGWIWVKLSSVFLLTVTHIIFCRWQKYFYMDENKNSALTYRLANEVPTILMVIIVIMVVLKPF